MGRIVHLEYKLEDDLNLVYQKHSGLRQSISLGNGLSINGCLRFKAQYLNKDIIEDKYYINISIPHSFPSKVPTVVEIKQRIPRIIDRHVFPSGALCLGSKLKLRIKLKQNPTILEFIDTCIIPYFYANSYYEIHGNYPWGELKHGYAGLADDYIELFELNNIQQLIKAFKILSLSKFKAGKMQCPCGCNKRYKSCKYKNKLNSYIGLLSRAEYKEELNKSIKNVKSKINVVTKKS